LAKTASNKPPTAAEEALKQQKKQARQEAKLMLEIKEAEKAEMKAQKKLSKAQERLEAKSRYVQTLEARLAEFRATVPEPEIEVSPHHEELEHLQEQPPHGVEKDTPPEEIVTPQDESEINVVEDQETAISLEPSYTKTTPAKANAQRAATRRSTTPRKPASQSTATKRPATRTQRSRKTTSDAGSEGS
jgi:chromosome segregation ATPase